MPAAETTAVTAAETGSTLSTIKASNEVITIAAGFPTTVNPIIQNNSTYRRIEIKDIQKGINYKQKH